MSHPSYISSLSLSARLLCYLGPPSAILLTSLASPRTALTVPLSFLPTAWFFKKWQHSKNADASCHGSLEMMVWTFAAAGTVGLTAVMAAQLLTCKAASVLLFRSGEIRAEFWKEFFRATITGLTASELARRVELASSWQNWVFNGVLAYAAAGITEEALKYLPIAYARRREIAEQRQQRSRAYIDYVLAGALSFGFVECIGFLYTSCEVGYETVPIFLLNLFERIVLGQFGHLLLASLTALRATRRDFYGDELSWWQVVGPSAILHGTFNFIAISASALEGNVGWIHPTRLWTQVGMFGICAVVDVAAALKVIWEWKELDNRDRGITSSKDSTSKLD